MIKPTEIAIKKQKERQPDFLKYKTQEGFDKT